MKAKDIVGGKPSAMPPFRLKAASKAKLLSMIKWMAVEMPAVAQEAQAQFGGGVKDGSVGVGVVLDFKCSEPASFREYIRRVTNDIFQREPTADELALTGKDPDEPATAKDRKKVVAKLFGDDDWKAQFEDKGLKKFAAKLSGVVDIKPLDGMVTGAQAEEIGRAHV